MPQSAPDAFSASVLDIVMLNRFPHLTGWGWEGEADREAARAALDLLGLAAFAARDVLSLSGGERQRVALAAVLCQEAPLLLLDEPLSHLDLHHQIECLGSVAEWTREPRRTLLFSCHDLNLARRFATHALLLDGAGARLRGACARGTDARVDEPRIRLSVDPDSRRRARGADSRAALASRIRFEP